MFSYLCGSKDSPSVICHIVYFGGSLNTNLLSSCCSTEIIVSSNMQLLVSTNIFLATESGINWVHRFAKLWISFPDIIEHGCKRQQDCCVVFKVVQYVVFLLS